MNTSLEVSGTDLRYLLTAYLLEHGPATVDELVDALTYHGFRTVGRASKSVSDALRWERARGRVIRFRRGRYRPGSMPRATEHRIFKRVRALHDEVAELSRRGGHGRTQPNFPAA
ncbi:hypothetical protein DQP55_17585 [Mycolicibacterium sp. GF69]|uniref:hypothetical protein n=1 Tax=Mycolicibacterium sp. GF69 TaxID=2267251 RepID=UPI000DCE939A|nr:hypothetical protein [Mycolicibacterium sp. GF69]RAV09321.1 hypothetical protein DQP55_17585 [Mycolicibacterium sp. GF69]